MALDLKFEMFLNDNEIIIYDSSGWYSANNLTGWCSDSISGTNASVNDIITILLTIDGVDIQISSGTNEAILPCTFAQISSPGDLIFTIYPDTYSSFYN